MEVPCLVQKPKTVNLLIKVRNNMDYKFQANSDYWGKGEPIGTLSVMGNAYTPRAVDWGFSLLQFSKHFQRILPE